MGNPTCPPELPSAKGIETIKPLADILEELRDYISTQQQKFEDFKDTWHSRRLLILGTIFLLTVAGFSLFAHKPLSEAWEAYAAAFLLCMLAYTIYLSIEAYRGRKFRNNPYETFIKALLFWDENREMRVES